MVGSSDRPWLFVFTKATSLTLPAAFVPAPGSSYTWQVRHYPGVATVDGVAGPHGNSFASGPIEGRQISVP